MQKTVFIKSLSDKVTFSEETVSSVVENMFQALAEALIEGRRIEIRGFGVFSIRARGARVRRNPKTGDCVVVPTTYSPHFQVSREIQKNFS